MNTDFTKILIDFKSIPKHKRTRTFMEISGYPHYENVCSNILKFYLDTKNEHGLKNLVLNSLRIARKWNSCQLLGQKVAGALQLRHQNVESAELGAIAGLDLLHTEIESFSRITDIINSILQAVGFGVEQPVFIQ